MVGNVIQTPAQVFCNPTTAKTPIFQNAFTSSVFQSFPFNEINSTLHLVFMLLLGRELYDVSISVLQIQD